MLSTTDVLDTFVDALAYAPQLAVVPSHGFASSAQYVVMLHALVRAKTLVDDLDHVARLGNLHEAVC